MSQTIVVAANIPFWRGGRGGFERIIQLVKFLQADRHLIHVFYAGELVESDRSILDECKLPCYATGYSLNVGGQTPQLADFYDKRLQLDFQKYVAELSPDVVIVERIHLGYLIDNIDPAILTLVDTLDVLFKRYESFASNGRNHWISISPDEEGHALDKFDCVVAIQEKDKSAFQTITKSTVISVPHYTTIRQCFSSSDKPSLVFVGTAGHHNQVAVDRFIEKIVPALVRENLNFDVKIVGSICDYCIHTYPTSREHISYLGCLETLDQLYSGDVIVVNPTTMGGGLKIKNVEALCRGLPLVTTSVGAEGLERGCDRSFKVGDEDEEFIRHLVTLINSSAEREKLSECAFQYAKEEFDEQVVYRSLKKVIEDRWGL